nr:pentatricopeptide repeat-containing protein At4g32430, mitochondrial [Ipomoea trifida]
MLPLPPLHPLSSPFLLRTADNTTASTAGDSLSSVDNDSMKCPSQPQSQFEALKVFKKQFQMGVSEIDEVAIALALKACKAGPSGKPTFQLWNPAKQITVTANAVSRVHPGVQGGAVNSDGCQTDESDGVTAEG